MKFNVLFIHNNENYNYKPMAKNVTMIIHGFDTLKEATDAIEGVKWQNMKYMNEDSAAAEHGSNGREWIEAVALFRED